MLTTPSTRHHTIRWTVVFSCALSATLLGIARGDVGKGQHGIVASVHPLATQAGLDAMKSGGNAIDAAVAVGLTLGVVDGYNSGIGGGCFMLIRRANGEIIALDGREMAPAKATRNMYLRDGKADTNLSQTGALASGIPGSVAVYEQAVKKYGKRRLADLLFPAADIAERGFPISHTYAQRLASTADELKQFEASRAIFLRADGTPYQTGDVLKQTDLAASYRKLATQGGRWFYGGDYAKATEAWMKQNGGIITARDFANYKLQQREPILSNYRGYEIVSFPPPSSGGVHVAQILNILKNFDIKAMSLQGRTHVVAEAMKLAFADRAFWLGDPKFANVPRGLVDESYGRALAKRISLDQSTKVESHGTPPDATERVFAKHTTHFSTADAHGNWVACTATVNTSFGSKVVIPGTGIILNNQMDDFSIQPGVPNAFGLVGAEANAVKPGKRPLSSMSPTIVLRDKKPILSLGAAGGPTIISQTLLNLVGILDLGMPIDTALSQPRYHHQWAPDEVRVEKSLPADIKAYLINRGHKLNEVNSMGVSQIVAVAADGNGFVGAADPRVEGLAAGW